MRPVGLGVRVGARGERLRFRLARPSDEARTREAFDTLSHETRHNRFMAAVNEIPADILASLRHPDRSRELMVVCLRIDAGGREVEAVGAARLMHGAPGSTGEIGIVIVDAWQRRGVGAKLLRTLIQNARRRGLAQVRGHVLATNEPMLSLARSLGFSIADSSDEGARVKIIALDLDPVPAAIA
jgi:acetyltransferase